MNQYTAKKDKKTAILHQAESSSSLITFSWLLHLRWGAVACQMLLIGSVTVFFDTAIPTSALTAILLFEVASNFYFTFLKHQRKAISQSFFAAVMFLDVLLLTSLLYLTGGPMNPFTFLFLVHIVLGAVLMRPNWSWPLTISTIGCYGLLFLLPKYETFQQLPNGPSEQIGIICVDLDQVNQNLSLHLHGMWVAFSITAIFIVFFIGRIQKALEIHQKDLSKLKEEKIRIDRLAALATLSAGAAHELSTPLSTIAVAAGEMQYALKNQDEIDEVLEDIILIQNQVTRCKDILFQMSSDAGEHLGESIEKHNLKELFENIVKSIPHQFQNRIIIENNIEQLTFRIPFRSLQRSIRGLIDNGLDATSNNSNVMVKCWIENNLLCFEVEDKGAGMSPSTLERAVEPFFTTKDPGKGLGLGLFLAKSLAEQYGGNIQLNSTIGQGSTVRITFSMEKIGASVCAQDGEL